MLEAFVGAQRGDEGLLEDVLGVVRTDRGDEVSEYVRAMLIEQVLKGGKRFISHPPTKRRTPGFRETVGDGD
jgi:hypothetical protein